MYLSCTCLCIETCFYYLNKYFKLRTFQKPWYLVNGYKKYSLHLLSFASLIVIIGLLAQNLKSLKTLMGFIFYFSHSLVSRWFMTNFKVGNFRKNMLFQYNIKKKSILIYGLICDFVYTIFHTN